MEKIAWRPWDNKTFKTAAKHRKPILLAITAKWCHWCHVMDAEVWADSEVAKAVNERFVPVRVDTDERPDINERYNLGGWPTTAFLSPDGRLISGGTYIPADKMLELLDAIPGEAPDDRSAEPFDQEDWLAASGVTPSGAGEISAAAEVHFTALLGAYFDRDFGGFGTEPKFPMLPALAYALTLAVENPGMYDEIVHKTLIAMAESPLLDVDGGFFRYAQRRDWSSPHFEKLLIDQAEAAITYIDAFRLTSDNFYADVAHQALDYAESSLMRSDGLFGASQVADEAYYRLSAAEREGRDIPAVDATAYSGWNARIVSALMKGGDTLGRPDSSETALAVLNCVFNRFQAKSGLFRHGCEPAGEDIFLLNDQAMLFTALLDCYELSGNASFVAEAVELAKAIVGRLYNVQVGAFRDRLSDREDFGSLSSPLYPIEQNAKIAIAFHKLFHITDNEDHLAVAKSTVAAFSNGYHRFGLNACDYAMAVNWLTKPTIEVFLAGEKPAILTSALWRKAKSARSPRTIVIVDGRAPVKTAPPGPRVSSEPAALVCVGTRCLQPAYNEEELEARFKDAA